MNGDAPIEQQPASLRTLTSVVYGLYALSLIFGVTAIIAVVVDYIKRDEARGTWLESHFRWQIHTFWWSVVWLVAGALTFLVLVGWVVWGVAYVWFIYRIAKGWLNLHDGKPMVG